VGTEATVRQTTDGSSAKVQQFLQFFRGLSLAPYFSTTLSIQERKKELLPFIFGPL
jgi:hypothetical protein